LVAICLRSLFLKPLLQKSELLLDKILKYQISRGQNRNYRKKDLKNQVTEVGIGVSAGRRRKNADHVKGEGYCQDQYHITISLRVLFITVKNILIFSHLSPKL
jgi:hypothetical protein